MSIQAMAWAIEQQEITNPASRLVLLCLANYSGADGCNAFPSILRLMRDTGLSKRAVQTHLKKLIKHLLIKRGNQAIVAAHIPRSDRRPTVYDLLIPRDAPPASRESTGCTPRQNGVHMTTSRGAPPAPNPFRDPSENLKRNENKFSRKILEEAQRIAFRDPLPMETEASYKTQLMLAKLRV